MQEQRSNTQHPVSRFLNFWTEERSLTLMLLLLVLHLFILTPVRFISHAFFIISFLFLALALLAGLLGMVRRKVFRLAWLVAVAGAILFKSASIFSEAPWLSVGDTLFTFVSLSGLVYVLFLQVSQE